MHKVRFFLLLLIFSLVLLFQLSAVDSATKTQSNLSRKEAKHYISLENKAVQCLLCPRECILNPGATGFCRVRRNIGGKLYSLVYGKAVAQHIDPIEKKPIFHVLPGTKAFSVATAGCNLGCIFCQNWQISQVRPEDALSFDLPPDKLVDEAIKSGAKSIAYTYTEPSIFYEYVLDTAKIAREKGIKNIMVTAEYINPEPIKELYPYIDAANCDLKGFSDEFYRKYCHGKLVPVLEAIKAIHAQGTWVEITNLIIPTVNDDMDEIREMCLWIKDNLGPDVPLHFSRFSPAHKLRSLPPTAVKTLEQARQVALSAGLNYVYIGNVSGHPAEHTYCPKCMKMLIRRAGYFILTNHIENGKCKFCGETIPGIWE